LIVFNIIFFWSKFIVKKQRKSSLILLSKAIEIHELKRVVDEVAVKRSKLVILKESFVVYEEALKKIFNKVFI